MPAELDLATSEGVVVQGFAVIARLARLVLLDLTGLSFCDARGLSAFVRIANQADMAGCGFGLIAPRAPVAKILRISGLDRRRPVFATFDDALGSARSLALHEEQSVKGRKSWCCVTSGQYRSRGPHAQCGLRADVATGGPPPLRENHRPGQARSPSQTIPVTRESRTADGSNTMSDIDTELGPVDYLVVAFPAGKADFSGEMASELRALMDTNTVRLLDLVLLSKDLDGSVEASELRDADDSEVGQLRAAEADLAVLLAESDVEEIGGMLEPGSSAAVLVWENTWAAPFGSAVRRSGGQLVTTGRIPTQAILAAIEADRVAQAEGV